MSAIKSQSSNAIRLCKNYSISRVQSSYRASAVSRLYLRRNLHIQSTRYCLQEEKKDAGDMFDEELATFKKNLNKVDLSNKTPEESEKIVKDMVNERIDKLEKLIKEQQLKLKQTENKDKNNVIDNDYINYDVEGSKSSRNQCGSMDQKDPVTKAHEEKLKFHKELQKQLNSKESANSFFTTHNNNDNNNNKNNNNNNNNDNAKNNQEHKDDKAKPAENFNEQIKVILLSLAVLFGLDLMLPSEAQREITWQDFYNDLLSKGYVEKLIVVNKSLVRVVLNDVGRSQTSGTSGQELFYFFTIGSIENFEHKLKAAQKELNVDAQLELPIIYVQEGNWAKAMYQILPTALMIAGIVWLTRKSAQAASGGKNGIFGISRSKAKKFNTETNVKVKFKDVAGCDEAKEEIMEFVSFLKEPFRYEKMGAKIPRGAILSGPPGTGKTLLAKATAGEAGVPFYFVSGSEFVEMFVGVGAARVRDLFKTAKENAPSIVFIDEIDAIGKARQKGNFSGANDERENTLNQLLVEMDGFTSSDHIVVLAGTNRPDILDRALLRPGRFDRHINIDKPELEGRKAIFDVHLKKIKVADDIYDLKNRLSVLTPGFSGADIANVCNEAALIAARDESNFVTLKHFEQAVERVIGGVERKSKVLSPEEKKVVAYHEAGHAICGWFLEFADPLLKVSIIPRGQGALGYAQYVPGDLFLLSEQQLLDRITMTLGGRVSEEIHFDSVTSGASDDFRKITRMATSMVTQLGMSNKIGWINFHKRNENDLTKPYSEETAIIVDAEVYRIIQECHDRCEKLLKEHADDLEKVAQLLLVKEVLTREDMIRLLGKRPFPERNDAFDKYLNENQAKNKQNPPAEPASPN